MGAGCSKDQAPAKAAPTPTSPAAAVAATKAGAPSSKNLLASNSVGTRSGKTRQEDLQSQFVAEFPQDDESPSWPEGSREATLMKVFDLLDQGRAGYITVARWKEYAEEQKLSMEALGKELVAILQAEGGGEGESTRVTARQFVEGTARMVAPMEDTAFGQLVARTLMSHRAKSRKFAVQAVDAAVEEADAAAPPPPAPAAPSPPPPGPADDGMVEEVQAAEEVQPADPPEPAPEPAQEPSASGGEVGGGAMAADDDVTAAPPPAADADGRQTPDGGFARTNTDEGRAAA
ncbi:hypothetical protein HYH03_010981 [Edaphochlamys debaryana]|uniref:EF-hand domain-containing protein n=1 Tax=Edaphochlamys debaryana TaxID=47281 RepID=A0A836BW25_9CHLO|nr:hypothetical protein HYH03_010981 [Edaphochlamys debaryana]|eukprot:KAG2490587.1 hypothetical protein HYH03_010981 [Edaphochlamys debaryana]